MPESPAKQATKDLRRQLPIHRTGRGFAESGVPEVAWFRGHHAGVFDAYCALRHAYPGAARALLVKFSMKPDGSIG